MLAWLGLGVQKGGGGFDSEDEGCAAEDCRPTRPWLLLLGQDCDRQAKRMSYKTNAFDDESVQNIGQPDLGRQAGRLSSIPSDVDAKR